MYLLCFARREGHYSLPPRGPANCSTANVEDVSCSRSSLCNVTSPVRISISKQWFKASMKSQLKTDGSTKVAHDPLNCFNMWFAWICQMSSPKHCVHFRVAEKRRAMACKEMPLRNSMLLV